jgi:hypothetical protein
MALGCPVELKLSLESCPGSSVALEGLQGSQAILHCASSSSGFKANTGSGSGNDVSSEFQLRQPRSSRHEMLTGLAARSRRLADAGSGPRLSSHARNYNHCFPAAGSSRRYRSGRRPSLTRVPRLDAPGVKVRWQHPKFKSITIMERRNRFRIFLFYSFLINFASSQLLNLMNACQSSDVSRILSSCSLSGS